MTPQSSPPADNGADNNDNPPTPHGHHAAAPRPGVFRRYYVFFWVGGGLLASFGLAALLLYFTGYLRGEPFSGPTVVVKKEVLRVTIVERGNLESAENSDIVCRVKAKTQGGTIASTIKWVIDDGTLVKQGDLIVDLDDSGFQEQMKAQKNIVSTAYSGWIEAKANLTIQESENESKIKTAEVNLIQMELEIKKYAGDMAGNKLIAMTTQEQLRKYLDNGFEADVRKESALAEGRFTSAYLQDVSSFEGIIETARSDKDSWMDRASWSQRMVKKGFYSLSQADADQSRLESMKIALRKAEGDLDIYRIFEREKNITKKWSDVKEAERALKRERIQADSKMEQKRADQKSKKAILDQEDEKLRDLMREEKNYKILSPQDGMIVYYIPEQARFGGGSQQSTVAQGEPVREGQKLMRIPNLKKMLVNARVHEAMISKVFGEDIRNTGFGEAVRTFSSLGRQDLFGLAGYQLFFDQVREKDKWFKDRDQVVKFPGQTARIRVDAFPGKTYTGHVKSKATVASQAEFFSSDVKVYTTMVSIDDLSDEKLQPGMSAEVTILADDTKAPVLVIPIQSVVGNVSMGSDRKCFVIDRAGNPAERDIVIGKSNDKLVEIKSGLTEGDKVVLNPGPLLPKKSDMKPGTPGTRRGAEFDEAGKKGDKGGKGKGKGGGQPQPPPADNKNFQPRSDAAPVNPQRQEAILQKKDS